LLEAADQIAERRWVDITASAESFSKKFFHTGRPDPAT
jgi:hypothetical protein